MPESSVSGPPTIFLPRWARISFACFMFAVASLQIWMEFSRFGWVQFICLGLYCLLYVPMQKGESRRAYFSKPRTIVSFALVIGIIAGGLHALHLILTK